MALLIFLFWVVLNGKITLEIVLLGAAITALAEFFLCRFCDWSLKKEGQAYLCLPRMAAYSGIMIWEIMKANMALAKIVFFGRPEPVVRTVHTKLKTRMARTVLANSITLTPGTITLSCEGDELTVHCLTKEMAEGLDCTVFEERLLKMEEALHG